MTFIPVFRPCGRVVLFLLAVVFCMGDVRAVEPPSAATHTVPDSMAQRMQACTLCHGKEGRATQSGYFPRIAGKPAGYLYHQLLHFREGRRQNAGMTALLDPLSDAYLRDIAAHFAGLDLPYPPPQVSTAAPAELARGQALARYGDAQRNIPACVACHGQALTGVQPAIPGLLGLPRDYLIGQLGAWQTGLRHAHAPDCMAQIAQAMTLADVSAVSHWLAAQALPANTHPVPSASRPLPLRCGSAPQATQ
jgi:cytochrome c553